LFGTRYADFELQIRMQLQQMLGDSGFGLNVREVTVLV
jgi:hypothetical protein